MGHGWRPYVSAAKRRHRAAKRVARLKKSGRILTPVAIDGRAIARTFWGQAWCENLEAYSDYSNRLPRGRTYARNGSVIDLQIDAGEVRALVSGSSFYQVGIGIRPLAKKRWDRIKTRCAGKIDSMVELLQGSISKGVMEVVTHRGAGLFPPPEEISLSCSCPDWATLCKHVAAALYGVGARLDHEPEMLFTLRGVDPAEMITAAFTDVPTTPNKGRGRILETDDVSSIFGIDLNLGASSDGLDPGAPKKTARKAGTAKRKKPPAKKATPKKGAPKKGAPKKGAPKKATPKKATPKKATPKKATPKKAGARTATRKKARGKKTTTR